jgi:AcrR family transcriptional regulator
MVRRRPGRPLEPVRPEALLDAAARVFARDGYGAARLSDVAAEVGISKGALAWHHPSKEALYLAVVEHLTAELGGLVSGATVNGQLPWPERLDALGQDVTRVLAARPDAARVLLRELVERGPFLAGPGAALVGVVVSAVVAFLEEGARDGHLAVGDLRHLAGTIVLTHLGWFGTPALVGALGADPALREREVLAQIRRLCGLPPR